MISDAQFVELDAEIWTLIAAGRGAAKARAREAKAPLDAAMPKIEVSPDADDERRIERIIEKARFEAVVKDSMSFLFKTLGAGAIELTSAVIATATGEVRPTGAGERAPGEPSTGSEPAASEP